MFLHYDVKTAINLRKFVQKIVFMTILFFFYHPCFANNNELNFPNACAEGTSIVIAAVGDILLHEPLQKKQHKKDLKAYGKKPFCLLKMQTLCMPISKALSHQE